jgi:hypothetical protein
MFYEKNTNLCSFFFSTFILLQMKLNNLEHLLRRQNGINEKYEYQYVKIYE